MSKYMIAGSSTAGRFAADLPFDVSRCLGKEKPYFDGVSYRYVVDKECKDCARYLQAARDASKNLDHPIIFMGAPEEKPCPYKILHQVL